ncbi:MAG: 4-hydroxy-3-methylbut-2-enyl diphosphate reductase [Chitinispirillaceae bacterium]|nr:4-hydroxy-3-methylbut-2-enyl diphosphate reductase [Chitinispirillaceae bacterium]
MKLLIAKTAGFCMGVKRAVDLALENAGKVQGGLKTIGPLIHNRQTVEMLKARRVVELNEEKQGGDPQTLLIRAHGIPPEKQERFVRKGHTIIDGTCPKVKTVHKVIARYRLLGYSIVITGDEGHAEVVGLLGYAGDEGRLIHSVQEVETLPELAKICLVSQTTFDRTVFDQIADAIRRRFTAADIVVKKTICAATEQRQEETKALARQVDALIVVGGKNSANTQRLATIASACGTPTQLVETEQEIDWNSIAKCKMVGITAGASTPNWMIKRVTDYLQFMDQTQKRTVPNLMLQAFDIVANCNVFVALGAVAVYYVSCRLQGFAFNLSGAAVSFLYFLSMYLWNSLTSIESTAHHGISRYRFYERHKRSLFLLAVAAIAALLIVSYSLGTQAFFIMLFATAAGSAYHATIVPKFLRSLLRYKKLKDIPTSRDLFVALAWSTVITFIPQVVSGVFSLNQLVAACFGWIFILAFLRSLIFDLRDIEGDRIMGRETLITIVGEQRARTAIYLITGTCVTLLALIPWLAGLEEHRQESTLRFLSQIPALLYAALFVKLNPRLKSKVPAVFNVLADSLLYLAGAGALISFVVAGE